MTDEVNGGATPTVRAGTGLEGQVLGGRFELQAVIAHGMDVVYRGHDRVADRPVAVKVLTTLGEPGPDVRASFQREAKALSRLTSDHVGLVFDYGVTEAPAPAGYLYLVMQWVEGEPLAALLARGALTPAQVAVIVEPLAGALTEAHRLGVFHRDLKPGNVFVKARPDGHFDARLIDFEIGLAGERARVRTAMLHESPSYMAPEQSGGETDRVTARTDVYLLALLVWEMLAGRAAFAGGTPKQLLLRQLRDRPPPLPGPADAPLRVALDAVLRGALEKSPDARPRTIDVFADAVRDVIAKGKGAADRLLDPPAEDAPAPPPPVAAPTAPAKRNGPIVVAVLAVLAAIGTGLVFYLKFLK